MNEDLLRCFWVVKEDGRRNHLQCRPLSEAGRSHGPDGDVQNSPYQGASQRTRF
jgi:hypothetical protein